jgi:hypothetical protein
MPKGPETMPATGKGTIMGSPRGRTGTWKVALVQERGGGFIRSSPRATGRAVPRSRRRPSQDRRPGTGEAVEVLFVVGEGRSLRLLLQEGKEYLEN